MAVIVSERQRLKELRALFRQFGFHPSRRRGQSFLIDENLRQLLVEEARLDQGCCVLEVGAGTGSLTRLLAERSAKVLAVEIDPVLCKIASEMMGSYANVEVIHRDILTSKHQLDPLVEERVVSYLKEHPESQLKAVGNLPYSIATPLIVVLLEGCLPVELMTFCLQREVADRLVATGGKSYGAVSVRVQAVARVKIFHRLPAHVFWPCPQVESRFVSITPDIELRGRLYSHIHFCKLVDTLFRHRRKRISSTVKSLSVTQRKELGLDTLDIPFGDKRPDQLQVTDFIAYSNALVGAVKENSGQPGGAPR